MPAKKRQNFLHKFLNNEKELPVLAAVAAGLYPIFFYFTNNFTLVNSWQHVGYFIVFFLCVPILIFLVAQRVSRLSYFVRFRKYVIPFLNAFTFLFFMGICHYAGIQKKMSLVFIPIAVVLSFFLFKQLKKVIVLQFILAIIGIGTFIASMLNQPSYSQDWISQPDDIEQAVFKSTPNVYLIQPDGYTNFSELDKGYYNLDNNDFKFFLEENGFINYQGFRSNYASTLSSNSSLFMMKHHYYNNGTNMGEALNARNAIVTQNPVLDIFKNNGYKTYLILEKHYLLLNKPKIGFDHSNVENSDVPYISAGLDKDRDVVLDLKEAMTDVEKKPKFFFIEFFNPGHIKNRESESKGREGERDLWMERLKVSNEKLTQLVGTIKKNDPNSLIIITADHGGYVGLDYAIEIYNKTSDRDIITSIFSSILSIHWPDQNVPSFDNNLKSSVNIFRVMFSYLSEDTKYLENLQDDESFILLHKGAPKGVYKYINKYGSTTFENFSLFKVE